MMTRISRLAATVFAAATVCLATGPMAQAASGTTITPNPATPGSTVNIYNSTCPASVSSGTATSTAFTGLQGVVPLGPGADVPLAGTATIGSSVAPGTYDVRIDCDDEHFDTSITVVPKAAPLTGDGASMTSGGGLGEGATLAAGGVGIATLAFFLRRRAIRGR